MDLGVDGLLEAFEKRFGWATGFVVALMGLAVAAVCVRTVIEATLYVYDLLASTELLAALREESVAYRLLVFAVQIALTFVAGWFIWRQFIKRRMKRFEARMAGYKAEITTAGTEALERVNRRRDEVMQAFALHKDAVEKVHNVTVAIQEAVKKEAEKIAAEKGLRADQPPGRQETETP